MGTRADFYVGRGANAEWLGSVAWDGYPEGFDPPILKAATEADFRAAVAAEIAGRDDGTQPEDGWPWPWNDSRTTDYAYAFDGDRVWISAFGREWLDVATHEENVKAERWPDLPKTATFPDMSTRKATTYGKRSGIILVGVK